MARDIKEKVKKKKTGMCNIAMHRYCLSDIIAGFIHIPKCYWMFLNLKISTLECTSIDGSVLEFSRILNFYITIHFTQVLAIPTAVDFLVFCSRELFLINLP